MQGMVAFREGNLNFVVQEIAFRTFIHLEGGMDHHIRVGFIQPDDLIVNFIMKQLLVGTDIIGIGLRFDKVPVTLFIVFLVCAMFAFV